MFRTTFLGHQGWLFSSGDSHLLLDPLLCDEFGNGPASQLRVYPPRRFDWERFPGVAAVLFSHEHEDHFHLGSIARLDRAIPIYLSDRCSAAARGILAEMGFSVRLMSPLRPLEIGRFEVTPLAQSMAGFHPGEWDTLALCIRDSDGHGGFFTSVDHRYAPITLDALRRSGRRPQLWTYPDNEMDISWMVEGLTPRSDDTEGLVRDLTGVWNGIPNDLRPQTLLVVSNGLSFAGDLTWLNGSLFNRDVRSACTKVNESGRSTPCLAPLPGDTVVMKDGQIVDRVARVDFLAALPQDEWPRHDAGATPADAGSRFGPATGRRDLDDTERARLPEALQGFAAFLYSTTLFHEIYELTEATPEGRRPTVAIELLEGERRGRFWEYRPHACAFAAVDGANADQYLAGATFWASDFLALLEARVPPSRIAMGRVRLWNARPDRFRFDLFHVLFHYGHPLRQPDAFLRLYRADLAARGEAPIAVGSAPHAAEKSPKP